MPLASSRTASEKRAAVVQAEKAEKERRERISLPRHSRSSTRVNRESVKRRRNSRAMSEERMKKQIKGDDESVNTRSSAKENDPTNGSPPRRKPSVPPMPVMSPTPYWKVSQERRESQKFSPVLTRSTKKKKKDTIDKPASRGVALAFSPPDQEMNARRTKEEEEKKEQRRGSRISDAQNDGRLLIYSPKSMSCRNFNMDEDDEANNNNNNNNNTKDENSDEGEQQRSFASDDQLSIGFKSSTSHISDMTKDSKVTINLEMHKDIKTIQQTLDQVIQDRRASDAGLLMNQGDKIALEAERAKANELEAAKSSLESTVFKLEGKLASGAEEFETEKNRLELRLESSQQEFSQKVRVLHGEIEILQKDKEDLLEKVSKLEDDLKDARALLSSNKADAKVIEELTDQLTGLKEKETEGAKLQEEVSKMTEIKAQLESEIKRTETDLASYKAKIADSESQLKKALAQNKEQESQMQQEIQTRESTINDLMERINVLRDGKSETTGELASVREELDKMKVVRESQDQQIAELQGSLSSAQKKFSKEKKNVEASLAKLKNALESSTAKVRATEDSKSTEARQKNERIMELESQLLEAQGKLGNAVERLSTSDEREDELLRKLLASDKIRAQLHNRVTQLSGNIRVFVRVRPTLPGEDEKLLAAATGDTTRGKRGKKTTPMIMESPFHFPGELDARGGACDSDDLTKRIIEIKEPPKDRGGLSERRKNWRFPFDNVFSSKSNQEDVWEAVEPLVQSAIDGFPTCIFAYGQTGSGKTYTMLGESGNEGIICRSVNKMFAAKHELEELSKGASKVEMSIELLEIYNEQVRDLLATNSGPAGKEINLKLTSQEVVGNVILPAASEKDVMNVLALAQSRRCVKATESNAESSRSHMVFTLHFSCTTKGGIERVGRLNICDLAGSERLSKSGANSIVQGDLMKETKNINSSLSVLSNVIEKLQAGSSSIPYRESKLTYLLKNSLGGNSKTLAIVCCNPHAAHFHESLCSIRFAEKVNKVELKAMANFKC